MLILDWWVRPALLCATPLLLLLLGWMEYSIRASWNGCASSSSSSSSIKPPHGGQDFVFPITHDQHQTYRSISEGLHQNLPLFSTFQFYFPLLRQVLQYWIGIRLAWHCLRWCWRRLVSCRNGNNKPSPSKPVVTQVATPEEPESLFKTSGHQLAHPTQVTPGTYVLKVSDHSKRKHHLNPASSLSSSSSSHYYLGFHPDTLELSLMDTPCQWTLTEQNILKAKRSQDDQWVAIASVPLVSGEPSQQRAVAHQRVKVVAQERGTNEEWCNLSCMLTGAVQFGSMHLTPHMKWSRDPQQVLCFHFEPVFA